VVSPVTSEVWVVSFVIVAARVYAPPSVRSYKVYDWNESRPPYEALLVQLKVIEVEVTIGSVTKASVGWMTSRTLDVAPPWRAAFSVTCHQRLAPGEREPTTDSVVPCIVTTPVETNGPLELVDEYATV
jgi:hypothetical protein